MFESGTNILGSEEWYIGIIGMSLIKSSGGR